MLDTFAKEYKHIGYKRLEIIKRLKIMGALVCSNNRNDVLVSIRGEKRRFYKILLSEDPEEAEEYEVVKYPVQKTEEKETEEAESK